MFEELGYEVYLKTITVVAEDPAVNPHEALVNRMREINELYRDMAYELMEKVAERPADGMPLIAEYLQIVTDGMTRLAELHTRMRAVG